MMRRITIMMVMMLGLVASAQEMKVKEMRWATNDLTACVHPRKDLNDTVCAVVKVIAPLKEMAFEGSIIGDVEYKTGEYWVYVTDNTRFLKIKHPLHEPLMVDFNTFECGRPKSKNTYELKIYSSSTAVTESTRSVESILAEVKEVYDKNDWMRVRELCMQIPDNPEAQFYIGDSYMSGGKGNSDYQQGLYWFKKSSASGCALGQFGLGYVYYAGQGVPQNHKEAIKWFQMAAEQGLAHAQGQLGTMYILGEGTAKKPKEGFKWIQKAAGQGVVEAQYALGVYYYVGMGCRRNKEEAYKWLKSAADQGCEEAKKFIKDNKF